MNNDRRHKAPAANGGQGNTGGNCVRRPDYSASSSFCQVALSYAARGWHVFPLAPRSKSPIKQSNGCLGGVTCSDAIRAWFTSMPDINIGIACGPSGLVVIDLDGERGAASWAESRARHDFCDDTVMALTGGGGIHLLFAAPPGIVIKNSVGRLGPGVDVRANGGYIVAPPSIHPSGQAYEWDLGFHPDHWDVAPLPDAVIQALTVKKPVPPPPPCSGPKTAWGKAALRNRTEELAQAAEGMRNDTLYRMALQLGHIVGGGHLDRAEVERELYVTAMSIGLTESETLRATKNGLDAGILTPRGPREYAHTRRPR